MEEFNLYKDIQARTGGEIYLGVVGPIRTGKSTFIRKFMENMVLPNLKDNEKRVALDELPTSGKGRAVTTVEPKFVPKEAAQISLPDNINLKVRLIDCVGFLAEGVGEEYEQQKARMVKTPWSKEEMPFAKAAQIGTERVIRDHATVGVLVTTDGSFGELPRESFRDGEERAIGELIRSGKPYVVVINSREPYGAKAHELVKHFEEDFQASALAVNCDAMDQGDVFRILKKLLYEFPLMKMEFYIPKWTETIPEEHAVRKALIQAAWKLIQSVSHIRDLTPETLKSDKEEIKEIRVEDILPSSGTVKIRMEVDDTYYYGMLSDLTGVPLSGEYQLISMIQELAKKKKSYELVEEAMNSVRDTGYGVITPLKEEISLEEPTVIKQGSKFGVKIRAASPSIHLIRADIETEIAPIVGSEQQAEDLITYIRENTDSKDGIWQTNIFGKSVEQLVEDGIRTKLNMIGEESQKKLQDTMKRIVNESKGSLICIII